MKTVTAISVSFQECGVFCSSSVIEQPAKLEIKNNGFSLEIQGKGLAQFCLANWQYEKEYNTSYPFSSNPDVEELKNFLDWLDSNWPETRVYFTANLVNSEGELDGEVLVYVDPSDFDIQYENKDVPIQDQQDSGNSDGISASEYITKIVKKLFSNEIEIPSEIADRIKQLGIEIPSEAVEPAEDCFFERD